MNNGPRIYLPIEAEPTLPPLPDRDRHLREQIAEVLASGRITSTGKVDQIVAIITERENELKAAVFERLADVKEFLW